MNLDLFAPPTARARTTDPETSHKAAEMVDAAGQCEKILKLMRTPPADVGGWTADEIDQYLGWEISTAGKRMGELEGCGLIKVTGEKRKTRRAQFAQVYRVCP